MKQNSFYCRAMQFHKCYLEYCNNVLKNHVLFKNKKIARRTITKEFYCLLDMFCLDREVKESLELTTDFSCEILKFMDRQVVSQILAHHGLPDNLKDCFIDYFYQRIREKYDDIDLQGRVSFSLNTSPRRYVYAGGIDMFFGLATRINAQNLTNGSVIFVSSPNTELVLSALGKLNKNSAEICIHDISSGTFGLGDLKNNCHNILEGDISQTLLKEVLIHLEQTQLNPISVFIEDIKHKEVEVVQVLSDTKNIVFNIFENNSVLDGGCFNFLVGVDLYNFSFVVTSLNDEKSMSNELLTKSGIERCMSGEFMVFGEFYFTVNGFNEQNIIVGIMD